MYFTILATVMFAFLFIIWNRSDGVNVTIKFVFFVMTVVGIVNCLSYFGWITHAPL